MAHPIVVNVPHKLGKAEARQRIQEGFGAMQHLEGGGVLGMMSLEKRWDGDQFHLHATGLGQKFSAEFEILEDSVKVTFSVPDFLAALGGFIKAAVTNQTVKALGHSK